MSIISKIKGKQEQIKNEWEKDIRFSKEYAKMRRKDTIFSSLKLYKASDRFFKIREDYVIERIKSDVCPVMNKYKSIDNKGEYSSNAPIWVCWWTGIDSAPKLVKQCVRSVMNNSGNHSVNIIDEYNYHKYINVPLWIQEKRMNGNMGLAHFCDYLRVCLLEQYGGLWLDATIFCSDTIPDKYFNYPLFTLKSEYKESRYISRYQWTTFCLGGFKGNVFYSFLKEAFESYWRRENYAIDYLFFDYLIYIAYNEIKAIKKYLDEVPMSTPHRDDLQAAMNARLPAEDFDKIIKDDTTLYKLSWREKYSETTSDGKESVYGYFVNRI